MIDSGDPACIAALAAALGHAAPFSDEEVARVTSLTIRQARDLEVIAACSALQHLRIVASELQNLMALADLESLVHLEIHCTRIESLLGMNTDSVERIDLLFTSLQDSTDLFAVAHRLHGTLIGNPWTPLSRNALNKELENGQIVTELGSDADWEECRALWERLGACSGVVAGDHGLLVRPGIPSLTANAYDAIRVQRGTAGAELRSPSAKLEKMFAKYADLVESPDLSAVAATREFASSEGARGWISGSTLPPADKASLERFVTRFPTIAYYRSTEAGVARTERLFGRNLPDSYRDLRQTLDGWFWQEYSPPVRFDRFEASSPREDRVGSLTYMLGLRGFGDDTKDALQKAGLVIVGLSIEFPQSTLVVRSGESSVYEYSEEDILSAMSDGRDIAGSIHPVFASYAAMLGHVVEIQGTPILTAR